MKTLRKFLNENTQESWEGFEITHERYDASIKDGKLNVTCKGEEVISLDKEKTKEFTDWVERDMKQSKDSKEDSFVKLMMVMILPF